MTREEFVQEVKSFMAATGLKPTPLGKLAVNDPNFVFDLEEGRSCSLEMADRVRSFMKQYLNESQLQNGGGNE